MAYRAIAFMLAEKEADEFTTAEIANALGEPVPAFGKYLERPMLLGFIERRMEGQRAMWSVGQPALDGADYFEDDPNRRPTEVASKTDSISAFPSIFAYAASRMAAPFSAALASDGRIICERLGRVVCEFNPDEAAILRRVATQGVQP